MKIKKYSSILLWIAIIFVAFVDAFGSWIGNAVPVIGTILASLGNTVWEILEIGLVYGLIKTTRKK